MFRRFFLAIAVLSIGLLDCPASDAEIIRLMNGRRLQGKIAYENESVVELKVGGGTMKFRREDILDIEKPAPNEIDAEFGNDGSIFVEGLINHSVKARLVVDTGASVVVLTPPLAKKLGITPEQAIGKGRVTFANGTQADAYVVKLSNLKIGSLEANNVEACVLNAYNQNPNAEPMDGLLGMSFIDRYHMHVDTAKKKLIFES